MKSYHLVFFFLCRCCHERVAMIILISSELSGPWVNPVLENKTSAIIVEVVLLEGFLNIPGLLKVS